jgi:hypothetical protein
VKRALARIALLWLGVAIPPLLLAQTEPVRRPSKYQALNTDKGRLLINNPAPLKLSVAGRLAFTVIDARPEVMSGERKPEFAGLSRSLYGIPSPNNGYRPVATFFGIALTDALAKGGVDHDSMVSRPYEGRDKALPALNSSGPTVW